MPKQARVFFLRSLQLLAELAVEILKVDDTNKGIVIAKLVPSIFVTLTKAIENQPTDN